MKRTGLAALMLFVWHVSAAASPGEVNEVSFRLSVQYGHSAELLDAARRLVTLRERQPMDTTIFGESIDALQMCGLFEEVTADTGNGRVAFLLVPARYVRDIRIRREFPLFEDDVEKALSTYPGDIFRDDALVRQDSLVTALYRREGFTAPRIDVTSVEHRAGTDRVMLVRVHPGDYYRLKTIELKGNRAVSAFQIRRRLKSWRASLIPGSAGRFVDAVFHDDVKALAEFYRTRGFADVAVHDTVIVDSATRSVKVIVSIDEGDRYRIALPGRRVSGFRKGMLKKDMAIPVIGNRNNVGIRKSVAAIERRLREAGFKDARVTASDTAIGHGRFTERLVRFAVERGVRMSVSSITIEGTEGLDEALVRGQMLHVDKGDKAKRAYSPDRLREDVFAVRMLYRSNGFLNAAVESKVVPGESSVAITIMIHEGRRTIIGAVSADTSRFQGSNIGKAVTVKRGDPFRNEPLKQDARALQAKIAELGFPHVAVTPVVTMTADSSRADVEFRIDEGPLVTLGDIRYIGAFRTREKVLSREFKTLPGKRLSLKDIVDAQRGVRDLGLFSSVRFRTIGLHEKRDTVHVFVEVAEKRPLYGSVSGGYQSDKGPFVNAQVGDRNIGGFNKEMWVSGEVSLIGFRGETGVLDPRFLGSRLRALVDVFGERTSELNQEWWSTAYGISTGITASPVKGLMLGLGNNYERRQLFFDNATNAADPVAIPDSLRPRNIVVLKPSVSLDKRDSFTRPRKGVSIGSSVDLSKSIGTGLDNFVKFRMDLKAFVTPFPLLTLAGAIRGGYLRPYGAAATVPADQRFYLGGTGDVRGFAENLFHPADSGGGNVSLCATIEARIALGAHFELALFSDVGRLEDDISSLSPDQFRSSAGGGIRYITPIGPVGILYGWKLERLPGEEPGAFHFSLGYTF